VLHEHRVLFIGLSPSDGIWKRSLQLHRVALFVYPDYHLQVNKVPDKQPESAFRRGLRAPRLNKYSSSFLHTKSPTTTMSVTTLATQCGSNL
jgi:hypothetical protein